MKKLLLIATLLFVPGLKAKKIDCNKHKIYCHILKNKPSIDKKYAMRLSNIIYNKSKYYRIDPFIYSAIIAQESYYKLKAKNCTYGLTDEQKLKHYNKCFDKDDFEKCREETYEMEQSMRELKVCTDFGLSQIHYRTIRRYNFEFDKLTTDLEYAVDAGMKVLKDFQKRYKRKELYWWTRYNSSHPIKRRQYRELVERFL